MKRARYARLGKSEWVRLLSEQGRGAESVRSFCARVGVSAANFYRWRRVLRSADGEMAYGDGASVRPARGGFVDLGALLGAASGSLWSARSGSAASARPRGAAPASGRPGVWVSIEVGGVRIELGGV